MTQRIPLGLNGTLDGTCIACFTPTDTALGYDGSLEGHIAFLEHLGIPADQSLALAEASPDRPADPDPDHPARWAVPYQLCSACAERTGLPAPVLVVKGAGIPAIRVQSDNPALD